MTFNHKTHIALVGYGQVGQATLNVLFNPKSTLATTFEIVGITNSKCMVLMTGGKLSVSVLNDHTDAQPIDMQVLIKHMQKFTNPTLIDCTASDLVPTHYATCFGLGINVVTPNKRGFAGDLHVYTDIQQAARMPTGQSVSTGSGLVFHESTVGAGLPILSTVHDLIDSGDSVHVIEGVFSGTLSYLFNQYSDPTAVAKNVMFSDIVLNAKNLGYTEPDPRDDLNGMDVARKLTILARLLGLTKIDSQSIKVESLVPSALQASNLSIPEFMAGLKDHDISFATRRQDATAKHSVLRYVGRIDCTKQTASVGLEACSADHPLSGLRGADNLVRIVTARFPNGIVIQGAGAGNDVTAFGIVSDLLKVHRMSAST